MNILPFLLVIPYTHYLGYWTHSIPLCRPSRQRLGTTFETRGAVDELHKPRGFTGEVQHAEALGKPWETLGSTWVSHDFTCAKLGKIGIKR